MAELCGVLYGAVNAGCLGRWCDAYMSAKGFSKREKRLGGGNLKSWRTRKLIGSIDFFLGKGDAHSDSAADWRTRERSEISL